MAAAPSESAPAIEPPDPKPPSGPPVAEPSHLLFPPPPARALFAPPPAFARGYQGGRAAALATRASQSGGASANIFDFFQISETATKGNKTASTPLCQPTEFPSVASNSSLDKRQVSASPSKNDLNASVRSSSSNPGGVAAAPQAAADSPGAPPARPVTPPSRPRGRPTDPPPTRILDFLFLGCLADATNPTFLKRNNIKVIVNLSQERYWLSDPSIKVVYLSITDSSTTSIDKVFGSVFQAIDSVRRRWARARRKQYSRSMAAAGDEVGTGAGGEGEGEGDDSSDDDAELPRGADSAAVSANATPDKFAGAADEATPAATDVVPPRVLVHCLKGVSRSSTVVAAYLMRCNGWTDEEAIEYMRRRRPIVDPNMGFAAALKAYSDSMSVGSRNKRRARLCLVVKNVVPSASDETVRRYFEDVVGDVWRINRRDATCAVFFGCRELVPCSILELRAKADGGGMTTGGAAFSLATLTRPSRPPQAKPQ